MPRTKQPRRRTSDRLPVLQLNWRTLPPMAGWSARSFDASVPLLVRASDITCKAEVLLGSARLHRLPADAIVPVLLIDITEHDAAAVARIDALPYPTVRDLALAADALRRAGLPMVQIAEHLQLTHRSEASRIARLARLPAAVLELLAHPRITIAHARLLLSAPGDELLAMALAAVSGKSMRKLRDGVSAPIREPQRDADLAALAKEIGSPLNTEVEIARQAGGAVWDVRLRYTSLLTLLGMLEQLGRLNPAPCGTEVARTLSISLTRGELDALVDAMRSPEDSSSWWPADRAGPGFSV